jgi:hypothetical protein
MRHAFMQRLDGAFQPGDAPALRGDQRGPAGKAADEFLDTGRFRLNVSDRPARRGLAQPVEKRAFRALGQRCLLDPERPGKTRQQIGTNPAAIVFDQIEIGRRYPGHTRQIGLFQAD